MKSNHQFHSSSLPVPSSAHMSGGDGPGPLALLLPRRRCQLNPQERDSVVAFQEARHGHKHLSLHMVAAKANHRPAQLQARDEDKPPTRPAPNAKPCCDPCVQCAVTAPQGSHLPLPISRLAPHAPEGPPITAQPSQLRHQQPISACSAADGGEDAGEQGAPACSALAAPGTPRVSQIPSPSPPSQRTMTGRQVPPLQAAPYCSSPQSSRSCYP
eukprot:XP_016868397.1 uncharacterized protein LOC107986762 [Homo sapiens]